MSDRCIWVTGGRGFAGRHLRHELQDRGVRVVTIDRAGADEAEGAEPGLSLDLSDSDAVTEALLADPPQAIVHLAALSSAAASFEDPRATLRNNLESTLGILEALRRESTPEVRLLAIGSCEEYGAPAQEEDLPLTEAQPLRPTSPYAVSKAAQTLLCQQYRRAHGIDVLCTRSFTHTGPGQRPTFVWSSFASQVARLQHEGGGRLAVGNLDVSRDLSDVRDVVSAYADLLEVPWEHDVVNVCSGREIRLRDALDLLLEAAECPIDVEVDPARLRPIDVPRFVGDATRLQKMIGWVPSRPIESTLRDLLEFWREQRAASPQSLTEDHG